jgi:hypothetical protein
METSTVNSNGSLSMSVKPSPIALIGAIYIAMGCDADDVAEVTYYALKNNLNLADELYKAFHY